MTQNMLRKAWNTEVELNPLIRVGGLFAKWDTWKKRNRFGVGIAKAKVAEIEMAVLLNGLHPKTFREHAEKTWADVDYDTAVVDEFQEWLSSDAANIARWSSNNSVSTASAACAEGSCCRSWMPLVAVIDDSLVRRWMRRSTSSPE